MANREASHPNIFGISERRIETKRHVNDEGRFLDDISLAGQLQIAFLRSPYAHADFELTDHAAAASLEGVVAVVGADALDRICQPWGTSPQVAGMVNRIQHPLAKGRVCYQGQAIAAVVAENCAIAEDALELIGVDWSPLPSIADLAQALEPDAALAHRDLSSNLAHTQTFGQGDVAAAFAAATHIVEGQFSFGRVTPAAMETRGVIASFSAAEGTLQIYQSHTSPHLLQSLYSNLLKIPEKKIRVICPDIGGSFGLKIHLYPDEIATCAISVLLGKPIKFVADRIESLVSDIHAREHRITARLAVDADGRFLAFAVDDLFGIGPFSNYPLSSAHEGVGAMRLMGAPYDIAAYEGKLQIAFQNKAIAGQYRGVGHPIACAVTEAMVDRAANALDLTPEAIRRINYVPDDGYPFVNNVGMKLEALSHHACLEKILKMMNIGRLREEQAELRAKGCYRGIGLSAFVEVTAPGPAAYGNIGIPLTTQDNFSIRIEPDGSVRCLASVTDQGQGTNTAIAQIAAAALGVAYSDVSVLSGDSAMTAAGSGAWASRTTAIGGELALRAALDLRKNVLSVASALLQCSPSDLDMADGKIRKTGAEGPAIGLNELATSFISVRNCSRQVRNLPSL
jgi:aerobic carbon-monoxide dehydrogenase large subunit